MLLCFMSSCMFYRDDSKTTLIREVALIFQFNYYWKCSKNYILIFFIFTLKFTPNQNHNDISELGHCVYRHRLDARWTKTAKKFWAVYWIFFLIKWCQHILLIEAFFERLALLNVIEGIDNSIVKLGDSHIVEVLHGRKFWDISSNTSILNATIEFLLETKRYEERLF